MKSKDDNIDKKYCDKKKRYGMKRLIKHLPLTTVL